MATSASDVPARFDLVLAGGGLSTPLGLVFLDALEPSLPFRTHRAIYSYSPTFIERQNVQGSFGDNQQDFWMTSTQKDWSLGEQQRYARVNDADSVRRYWKGSKLDPITTPGSVSIRPDATLFSYPAAITSDPPSFSQIDDSLYVASATNLYNVTSASVVDKGAHGLGSSPSTITTDTNGRVYLTDTGGGSVGVRKWNGAAFSTFSATVASALAFLNNTLYGFASNSLIRYDSAGTATTIFTWKGADGTGAGGARGFLAFGGKLVILISGAAAVGGATLWIYDGTAPSLIARLPQNFIPYSITELDGILFVGGAYGSFNGRGAVLYYANGTFGELWHSTSASSGQAFLGTFDGGLLFTDGTDVRMYDPAGGGTHVLASAGQVAPVGALTFFAQATGTAGYRFIRTGTVAASATITTSLFDFDSSLDKLFRGIKLDFDSASDGNGGTVDIAYRVGDVDSTYTTLQTGATAGTEYTLSGISGRSISVKVTLNKGTSTNGPVLKRVSVRAAPLLTKFKMGEYVLDCTGDGGRSPRTLRDGTPNPLSGYEQMVALQTAASSTTPLTVTDRRGSFTAIVDELEVYEEHPGLDDPTRSGESVVRLKVREV